MSITIPSHLSDDALLLATNQWAGGERNATAHLVAHLMEIEARGLHLAKGFSSLFAYCMETLHLSEDATFNRIEAVRLARRVPVILEMLDAGSLSLTTARLLGKILTPQNQEELLAAAAGRSKRAVEEMVARHAAKPDVPTSLRKVPVRTAGACPAVGRAEAASVVAAPVPTVRAPARVIPLAANRYELKVTLSEETRDKLRQAQDLLGHAFPSGDTASILDRALTLLLADLARKKLAATERPGVGRGAAPDSRHVPAAVKRAVWLRDGGVCVFASPGGRRCQARRLLEFHHRKPYAAGGSMTVENIELRCRPHNAWEADRFFGGVDRELWNAPQPTRSGTGGGP